MGTMKFLEKDAREITHEFQKFINEEVRKYWIGEGHSGSDHPCDSYEEYYLKIRGETSVLITAPHAVPHDRGKDKLKEQDDDTDLLAVEICKELNCAGLIPLRPLADPNNLHTLKRANNSPTWKSTREVKFFLAAEQMIKEERVKFLVDLHGITDNHLDDLVIGDAGVKNEHRWAHELKAHLIENGYKVGINTTRTPEGRERILSGGDFVRNVSIPALQLEIKAEYRSCSKIHELSGHLVHFLRRKTEELR